MLSKPESGIFVKEGKVTFLGRRLTLRFDKLESQESQNEIYNIENLSLGEKYFEIKPDTIFIESSKQTTEETKQQSENVTKLIFNKDILSTLENRNGSNNRGFIFFLLFQEFTYYEQVNLSFSLFYFEKCCLDSDWRSEYYSFLN